MGKKIAIPNILSINKYYVIVCGISCEIDEGNTLDIVKKYGLVEGVK